MCVCEVRVRGRAAPASGRAPGAGTGVRVGVGRALALEGGGPVRFAFAPGAGCVSGVGLRAQLLTLRYFYQLGACVPICHYRIIGSAERACVGSDP